MINQQTKNESDVSIVSEKLYRIADSILEKRENYRLSTQDIDKNNFIPILYNSTSGRVKFLYYEDGKTPTSKIIDIYTKKK